jgi:MFS family permease
MAAVINGKLMDFNYRRWAKQYNMPLDKKRSVDLRNFPIEKVRLQVVFIFYPFATIIVVCYGWVMERRANLAAPLILQFILGFCLIASANSMSSLLVDLYPDSPSTVTAANNLVRCWFGAAAAAVVSYMLNGMGWGWCFVLLGLLQLLSLLILWPVWKWGMAWREQRRVRIEKRKREKEGKSQAQANAGPLPAPNDKDAN